MNHMLYYHRHTYHIYSTKGTIEKTTSSKVVDACEQLGYDYSDFYYFMLNIKIWCKKLENRRTVHPEYHIDFIGIMFGH